MEMDIESAFQEWESSPETFSENTVFISQMMSCKGRDEAHAEVLKRYTAILADADMSSISVEEFRQFCIFARGMWPKRFPVLTEVLARNEGLIEEYAAFVDVSSDGEPDDASNPAAASDRDWLKALRDRLLTLSTPQFMRLAEAIQDHRSGPLDRRDIECGYERLQHRRKISDIRAG